MLFAANFPCASRYYCPLWRGECGTRCCCALQTIIALNQTWYVRTVSCLKAHLESNTSEKLFPRAFMAPRNGCAPRDSGSNTNRRRTERAHFMHSAFPDSLSREEGGTRHDQCPSKQ